MNNEIMNIDEMKRLNPENELGVMYRDSMEHYKNYYFKIKYLSLINKHHFLEAMHYAKALLHKLGGKKIDEICKQSGGDNQKAYGVFLANVKIKMGFTKGEDFEIDDLFAFDNDINDRENPLCSGVMLFCKESMINIKVEYFNQ